LAYNHSTYDSRIQLGASRRRREDAESLHSNGRWAGAIYLAGYAIECSLCALICYREDKYNFKDTQVFKGGTQGATLHNLTRLLSALPSLQRAIKTDRNGVYKQAWQTITDLWQKDELRYWDKVGNENDSTRFIEAVKVIHRYILSELGEA
jgi:hypothetical protein